MCAKGHPRMQCEWRKRIYIVSDGREGEDGEGEEVAGHILVAEEDLAEDAELVLNAATNVPPGRAGEDQEERQTKHGAIQHNVRLDELQSRTHLINHTTHHSVFQSTMWRELFVHCTEAQNELSRDRSRAVAS